MDFGLTSVKMGAGQSEISEQEQRGEQQAKDWTLSFCLLMESEL